ncbi:Large subunit GTPase 1 -like protein [Halotydeus destructor]|nr:Large subunit GTPase 1 -like protein [Halotydeus destructor]
MPKRAEAKAALGRTLIKSLNNKQRNRKDMSQKHTDDLEDGYDWAKLNVRSCTEETNLQEFLTTAELAGTEFTSEKLNVQLIDKETIGVVPNAELEMQRKVFEENREFLCIPRRPYWDLYTKPADLIEREKASFLEWRRQLAILQEEKNLTFTPFEKNLEFWRQLWRVIERSEVITQIVDARNPLLFYCPDLSQYVNEVSPDKKNLLLLNKADYLTQAQRKTWATYFDSVGISAVFFSAIAEEDRMELDEELNGIADGVNDIALESRAKNSPNLMSSSELVSFFKSIEVKKMTPRKHITIGLIGYPNVGKSSTINTILTEKKASVSTTPGKTKHFQTLFVDDELCLCDCPGLVYPNFVTSKAEMVINGILPIDQLTDHVPATNIVASLIPRHIFESTYGIVLPSEADAGTLNSGELLNCYGYMRGFMSVRGLPDNPRSARYILKDFVNGKLLYCNAPPGVDQKTFHKYPEKKHQSKEMTVKQRRIMDPKPSSVEFNRRHFALQNVASHSRGEVTSHIGTLQYQNGLGSLPPKSYNKHKNKGKREKSRRTYSDLDG